jgi:hypothetical protein
VRTVVSARLEHKSSVLKTMPSQLLPQRHHHRHRVIQNAPNSSIATGENDRIAEQRDFTTNIAESDFRYTQVASAAALASLEI